jgi:WD40 repeat protein
LVDEQECTLRGHSRWVTRVQFSDDGLQVISSSLDNTVLVSPILRAYPACQQSCVLILRAESDDQLRGPC